MSEELIVSLAGAVVALIFGYFPVLRVKYAGLTSEAKSGIMLGLMVVTALAVWGIGCAGWGWIDTGLACNSSALPHVLKLTILAIASNQGVNRIFPEAGDVKLAKAMR